MKKVTLDGSGRGERLEGEEVLVCQDYVVKTDYDLDAWVGTCLWSSRHKSKPLWFKYKYLSFCCTKRKKKC